MQLVAFDDLRLPGAGLGDGGGGLRSLIAAIGEDALDEGEEATRALTENKRKRCSGSTLRAVEQGARFWSFDKGGLELCRGQVPELVWSLCGGSRCSPARAAAGSGR